MCRDEVLLRWSWKKHTSWSVWSQNVFMPEEFTLLIVSSPGVQLQPLIFQLLLPYEAAVQASEDLLVAGYVSGLLSAKTADFLFTVAWSLFAQKYICIYIYI